MKGFLKKQLSRIFCWRKATRRDALNKKISTNLDQGIVEVEVKVIEGQANLPQNPDLGRLLPKSDNANNSKDQVEPAIKNIEPEESTYVGHQYSRWDDAVSELRDSGRPGKAIRHGEKYRVEYHDEWKEDYEKKKIEKKLKLEKVLQEQEQAKAKEAEDRKLRLEVLAKRKAETEAKKAEKARLAEEKRKRHHADFWRRKALIVEERQRKNQIKKEKELEKSIYANQQKQIFESKSREKILNSVSAKTGEGRKIIAQYRHPGSAVERMSELGIWIVEENGKYSKIHQSKDRYTYARKKREEEFPSREKAIGFCKWLVSVGWYRDVRLHGLSPESKGFPVTELPTTAEKIKARKEFVPWKERVAEMAHQFTDTSPDFFDKNFDDDIPF